MALSFILKVQKKWRYIFEKASVTIRTTLWCYATVFKFCCPSALVCSLGCTDKPNQFQKQLEIKLKTSHKNCVSGRKIRQLYKGSYTSPKFP